MLLVVFRSGPSLYAVDARRVVEVVPRVAFRPVPQAPRELTGLLSYRGGVVPVVDFGVLTGAGPARDALSSRVIVASYAGRDGAEHTIGLLAEDVSRVRHVAREKAVLPPLGLETAPYLGALFRLEGGLVQVVDVGRLLTEGLEAVLFGAEEGSG
jgi:chemotaxis-related protein WspB